MDTSIIEQVHEEIAGTARPLATLLEQVESEIAKQESVLADLKHARTQLRAVVKNLDLSLLPEEEKPKKKKDWQPKADRAAALHEFLLAHRDKVNGNGGFHAAGLTAMFPKELPVAYSTVHKVLAMLHEQGAIRLDSTGTGGAKFYKLVGA